LDTDRTFYKTLNGVLPRLAYTDYRYPGVGRWTRHLDPDQLEACVYGYHYTDDQYLADWLGETIYTCEPCPEHEPVDGLSKLVTCRLKLVHRFDTWTPKVQRLFAIDCAEHVELRDFAGWSDDAGQAEQLDWAINEIREFADDNRSVHELLAVRHDVKRLNRESFNYSIRGRASLVYQASGGLLFQNPVDLAVNTAREARARSVFGMAERRWQGARLVEYLEGRR